MSACCLVLAVGDAHSGEVLAKATPLIPRQWDVTCQTTNWGALLIAGNAQYASVSTVVMGTPVCDPWGFPSDHVPATEIDRRYQRYGDAVSMLASGPFALFDVKQGRMVRAFNGIIPVYAASGHRRVVGTHLGMVERLSIGGQASAISTAASVGVDGEERPSPRMSVAECLPRMDLRRFERSLIARADGLGETRRLGDVGSEVIARGMETGDRRIYRVMLPHITGQLIRGRLGSYLESIRARATTAWWTCGLNGISIYMPLLERVSVDTLSLVAGTGS